MRDMGRKTTGNDLDNAWINFDNVEVPKDALLNKYCDIVDDEYHLKIPGMRPFEMIGQRLYTGRIAVAQAALEYRKELFAKTKNYSDNKLCPTMTGTHPLSNIPQVCEHLSFFALLICPLCNDFRSGYLHVFHILA